MTNSNNKSVRTFYHLIEKSHRITKLKKPCLRSETVSCGLWMAEKQLKPKNTVLSLLMQSTIHISQGYFCHYGHYDPGAQSHSEQNNLRKILSWNLLLLFMLGKKLRVHCTPCKCAATKLYHQAEVIYLWTVVTSFLRECSFVCYLVPLWRWICWNLILVCWTWLPDVKHNTYINTHMKPTDVAPFKQTKLAKYINMWSRKPNNIICMLCFLSIRKLKTTEGTELTYVSAN